MNTIHTVIITTDFSEPAVSAAEYGAAFARHLGADNIVLYHSYSPLPVATEIPVPEPGNGSACG